MHDQSFLHYSKDNGYPIAEVYGILEDDAENLWISTNSGLLKLINIVRDRAKATGASFDELWSKITANYSLQRPAEESEIAAVAVFLASNESSCITGQVIVTNCGQHIIH